LIRNKRKLAQYVSSADFAAASRYFPTAAPGKNARMRFKRQLRIKANIASRNDRLTCSNTCRTRAYRDRQKRAQELHAAGKPPQEIAEILGSILETVTGWLHKEGDSKSASF
jgi:hypothetical protein